MITLKQWMELVDYKITEGSDYHNTTFGDNVYCLDSWNQQQDGHSFCVIFDTRTQEVYEVQAHDYKNQRAYRLINTEYREPNETSQAWDDVDYVDLEVEDDWIQKAQAIVNGEDYDTRVSVPIDFSDEELLKYMTLAHERDMTFNAFIEEALRHALDEFKRDPDSMKQRAESWKREKNIL